MESTLLYVASSGVIGRSEDEFDEFLTSNAISRNICTALLENDAIVRKDGRVFASVEMQDICLLENREIHLTDKSRMALGLIGSRGLDGVTQSELSSLLNVDHKTCYHYLKSLIQSDLIVRISVASKKSFTYICMLAKVFDDDLLSKSTSKSLPRSADHCTKDMILQLLSSIDSIAVPTKDLFAMARLHPRQARQFRRLWFPWLLTIW